MELVQVGWRQHHAHGRADQPSQVSGRRQYRAPPHGDGLEDPVAHGQSVVEQCDAGYRLLDDLAVDVRKHRAEVRPFGAPAGGSSPGPLCCDKTKAPEFAPPGRMVLR